MGDVPAGGRQHSVGSGAAALIVPKYLFFATLGLSNKWFTLPLIYGVHTLPMAIWILKASMEGVPKELDEAAYIDGASSLAVLARSLATLPSGHRRGRDSSSHSRPGTSSWSDRSWWM